MELSHGRENEVNPGVRKGIGFSTGIDDPGIFVIHSCRGGFPGRRRSGIPALHVEFPIIPDDVHEGFDSGLQPGVRDVAVQLQNQEGLVSHHLAEIAQKKGIGTAGEIGDIAAEKLWVSGNERGAFEDELAG
jgi:hypothetical protein